MTDTDTVKSYSVTLDEEGQTALKAAFESLVKKAEDGHIEPVAPPPVPQKKRTSGEEKDRRNPNVPSKRYTDNVHYWMQKNGAQLTINEDQFAGVIQALRSHKDMPDILYGDREAKIYDSDLICALRDIYRQPAAPEAEEPETETDINMDIEDETPATASNPAP